MKKLTKKLHTEVDSLQAYASCSCNCTCTCYTVSCGCSTVTPRATEEDRVWRARHADTGRFEGSAKSDAVRQING